MNDSRPASGVERLWLAADRICPPFVNQLVIEGRGPGLDVDRVAAAVDQVARQQPGCRMRLAGRTRRTRWVADGPVPAVRRVDGRDWLGHGPDGAPFLRSALSPRRGPTVEVLLVQGEPSRIVVRTHHALMDGRGTLTFAAGLFAALRGEDPPAAQAGHPTDFDLAQTFGRARELDPARDCAAPVTGASGGATEGTTWRRVRVPGAPRALVSRLALAIAAAAQGPCRVDIPVDLRPQQPGLRSTANLCGLIRLPVTPGVTPEMLTADLRGRIARGEGADFVLGADRTRGVPLAVMARVGSASAERSLALARYGTTATLSNLGRVDLGALSAPRFVADRSFFIPPGSPGLPLFIALTGDASGVELCGTAPAALASHGRLTALMQRLAASLA